MRVWALCVSLALGAAPVCAQQSTPDPDSAGVETSPQVTLVVSPVLLVDLDEIFDRSLFGQRVQAEFEAAAVVLAAENADLEAQLEAQEMDLAQRRPTMSVDDFRDEAEAFDLQAQTIREQRDAAGDEVERILIDGRAEFEQLIEPVLGRILIDRGAAVILYKDAAYIALRTVDITEQGIAALDATHGDGTGDQ